MDILFVLVPLSVLMALAIVFGLWWAVERGQFDDIEREGSRILGND
ncbi:MAG: cbb3-type cytochrome oxidase assembly protein CcoS [Variovorax paradoxus]|uniref:Cbb3-type cytochrome oxidase assembly protein CcoS n=1 Tax=Variovorax paradoxus TaxID=34073 RepID=A0A2W5PR52_VARPD|nr:MAG: cbb3-type cytochrome oxidase assembly protein CcoS [Variovorax paradoxus]